MRVKRGRWLAAGLVCCVLMSVQADGTNEPAFIASSKAVPLSTLGKVREARIPRAIVEEVREGQKDGALQPRGMLCCLRSYSVAAAAQWYPEVLGEMEKYLKDVPMAGFSPDWRGAILNKEQLAGVFGMALGACGESLSWKQARVRDLLADPRAKGQELARQIAGGSARVLLVFATHDLGLVRGRMSDFAAGLKEGAGGLPVAGGRILDEQRVFLGAETDHKATAIGIALGGSLSVDVRLVPVMKTVAGPFKVTRAEGRKLFALDGKDVAEVYAGAVGALPWGLKTAQLNRDYPFAVKRGGQFVVCQQAPLSEDGSFEFERPLTEGEPLYIVERAADAAQGATVTCGDQALLCLWMESVHNWRSFEDEQERQRQIARPEKTPLLKVYMDGEFVLAADADIRGDGPASAVVVIGKE